MHLIVKALLRNLTDRFVNSVVMCNTYNFSSLFNFDLPRLYILCYCIYNKYGDTCSSALLVSLIYYSSHRRFRCMTGMKNIFTI